MDVVLIRWPTDSARRALLGTERKPRLLLVEGDAAAPVLEDCLEDWIRVPADESDVIARVDALSARAAAHQPHQPSLDPDGVLRYRGSWVSLPPVEARLMGELVERFAAVVSRDQLGRSGWPDGAPGRNALDVHVLRLRRRISPLGLSIKTVRSRGYLLEAEPEAVVSGSRPDESDFRHEYVRHA